MSDLSDLESSVSEIQNEGDYDVITNTYEDGTSVVIYNIEDIIRNQVYSQYLYNNHILVEDDADKIVIFKDNDVVLSLEGSLVCVSNSKRYLTFSIVNNYYLLDLFDYKRYHIGYHLFPSRNVWNSIRVSRDDKYVVISDASPSVECLENQHNIECKKTPYFNYKGNLIGEYCIEHKKSEMIDVVNNKGIIYDIENKCKIDTSILVNETRIVSKCGEYKIVIDKNIPETCVFENRTYHTNCPEHLCMFSKCDTYVILEEHLYIKETGQLLFRSYSPIHISHCSLYMIANIDYYRCRFELRTIDGYLLGTFFGDEAEFGNDSILTKSINHLIVYKNNRDSLMLKFKELNLFHSEVNHVLELICEYSMLWITQSIDINETIREYILSR